MSRGLPPLVEIAQRLRSDPPCSTLNYSLIRELRGRGEYEAAAALETMGRQQYEAEKAILQAVEILETARRRSGGENRYVIDALTRRPRP